MIWWSRVLAGFTGGVVGLVCWAAPVALGAAVVGFILQASASGSSTERTPSEWFWYGFLYFGLFFIIPLGTIGIVTGVWYGLEAEASGRRAWAYVPWKYWTAIIEVNRQARDQRAKRRSGQAKHAEPGAAADGGGTSDGWQW